MDPHLVEPGWLEQRLATPGLVILDCNWHAPEANKSGLDTFRQGHLPGALHFDLQSASDPESDYPNMLPAPERFAEVAGALGIDNRTSVIVYDAGYVSARVWWMFRLFGHQDVRILDGGFRRWQAEGRPVETGDPRQIEPRSFAPHDAESGPLAQVADWRSVREALASGSAQIVDARVRERFSGELPSGYPGLPPGHMPGAVNLPWTRMMRQSGDFRFEAPEAAEAIFRETGIDPDRPIIATCGSGITAAVLVFQLVRMGRTGWRLYDGSWNEWGSRADLPRQSA